MELQLGNKHITELTPVYVASLDQFTKLAADKAQGAKAAFNAAQAVYSGTPEDDRGMRDIVLRVVNGYIKDVIDDVSSEYQHTQMPMSREHDYAVADKPTQDN